MKRILLLLFVSGMAHFSAWANDGVYYTSGNQLVPLAETDISVRKEILTITLHDDDMARVDVYYEFYNPSSQAKTVLMGFEADPSYNDDYTFHPDGKHPHIHDFTVEMNGEVVGHRNAVSAVGKFAPLDTRQWKLDEEMGTELINVGDEGNVISQFAYVYYFNATFQPGLNRVHHTYGYKQSETVLTNYEIPYKLSPAARWANGKIDDFTLLIRAEKTAKHFIVSTNCLRGMIPEVADGTGKTRRVKNYDVSYWEMVVRNGAIRFHTTDFLPSEEHELYIASADHLTDGNPSESFGRYYDRTDRLALYMWREIMTAHGFTASKQERIYHNMPYAHRGHVFKNAEIRRYFESLWWYMPDATYKDDTSDFTAIDWEFVKFKAKE